jgi:hypothetical protein
LTTSSGNGRRRPAVRFGRIERAKRRMPKSLVALAVWRNGSREREVDATAPTDLDGLVGRREGYLDRFGRRYRTEVSRNIVDCWLAAGLGRPSSSQRCEYPSVAARRCGEILVRGLARAAGQRSDERPTRARAFASSSLVLQAASRTRQIMMHTISAVTQSILWTA